MCRYGVGMPQKDHTRILTANTNPAGNIGKAEVSVVSEG